RLTLHLQPLRAANDYADASWRPSLILGLLQRAGASGPLSSSIEGQVSTCRDTLIMLLLDQDITNTYRSCPNAIRRSRRTPHEAARPLYPDGSCAGRQHEESRRTPQHHPTLYLQVNRGIGTHLRRATARPEPPGRR